MRAFCDDRKMTAKIMGGITKEERYKKTLFLTLYNPSHRNPNADTILRTANTAALGFAKLR